MNEGILAALATVSFAISAGYLARRLNLISVESEAAIFNLFLHILLPCFIFSKIVGNEKVKLPQNVVLAPLAGFLGLAVPMIFSYLVVRYIIRIQAFSDKPTQRTFALASSLQNYGYVAIPVIIEVFGDNLLGVLLLHNLGVELGIWSAGLMMLSGSIDRNSLKKIFNTPTITVILCLIINGAGLDIYIPKMVHKPVEFLGAAFMPVGLILVGATIYGCLQMTEESGKGFWKKGLVYIFFGNLFRSAIMPLTMIFIASIMPYSDDLKKVLIVQAAMPAAFLPIVLARHYGGRPLVALQISLSSLVIGFALLPFWIAFGKKFLAL